MRTRLAVIASALMWVVASCSGGTMSDVIEPPIDGARRDGATPDGLDVGASPDGLDVSIDADVAVVPDVVADGGDAVSADAPTGPPFCSLGTDVPGAMPPADFCVRQFIAPSMMREPRVMAFAPNGDLFVSAPSAATGAGVQDGTGEIVVLADDNRDGTAERYTFASIPDVHGLSFGPDGLYFTTGAGIFRTAYVTGQRSENASSRVMVAPFDASSSYRWTHGLSITPSGAVYSTTGVWGAACPDPNVGTIDLVSGSTLAMQASGFRNPMFVRCHYADETCLVTELGDDGGSSYGAHEKLILVHPHTAYGYPCCATVDHPATSGVDCSASAVTMEDASFPLNSTPFGLDWERGVWPAPYANAIFLALHGSFYTVPAYQGTRIVYAPSDPLTHGPGGPFQDFMTGFGATAPVLRRATDVTFAPDGRLFFDDDTGGGVYWVAPRSLRMR